LKEKLLSTYITNAVIVITVKCSLHERLMARIV